MFDNNKAFDNENFLNIIYSNNNLNYDDLKNNIVKKYQESRIKYQKIYP